MKKKLRTVTAERTKKKDCTGFYYLSEAIVERRMVGRLGERPSEVEDA